MVTVGEWLRRALGRVQGEGDRREGGKPPAGRRASGFTLVELMVVVAILSIIATLAIAAFNGYVRRSKTAEATGNLNQMFKAVSTYYSQERTGQGLTTSTLGACTVDSAPRSPTDPGKNKERFVAGTSFQAIGFSVADYVYFAYGITSGDGRCGWVANTTSIYTLFANGDVDGDDVESSFELAVGSDGLNTLYHARGFYILNEAE
jgi:prepilin-type N-terminal cleavage/methylation domain-containing protein